MQRPDTVDGLFHDGDPLTGQKGTPITAVFLNELLETLDTLSVIDPIGYVVTLTAETTLAAEVQIWANPGEGETLLIHLPVYDDVSATKRYRGKNIGQGLVRFDAPDGKTIDNELLLDLAPGDRFELAKDGANWQTT